MTIDIDNILAKLDPKTRARVQSAQDIHIEKQLTPSIGLTDALKGGFAYGRQVLVWGNKSAGKSSFCLQMIALAQKDGKTCAWIDSEASYDQSWAEALGVDSSKLIYSPAKTVNDMVDVATKLMDAGVDLIVVDSISALLPAIYFEKDGNEMKDLQDTKQIGAEAKDMTHAVSFGLLRLRLMLLKLALRLATKLSNKESEDQLIGLLITARQAPQIYLDNMTSTTKENSWG